MEYGACSDGRATTLDGFDPRTWDTSEPVFRMYAGTLAQHECIVDEEDYLFFTQWLWVPHYGRNGKKVYFRRAVAAYASGERVGTYSVYLHIEICKRAHGEPPTRRRSIADHWNGNSWDNRRTNLRWATKLENNRNRFGSAFYQRAML